MFDSPRVLQSGPLSITVVHRALNAVAVVRHHQRVPTWRETQTARVRSAKPDNGVRLPISLPSWSGSRRDLLNRETVAELQTRVQILPGSPNKAAYRSCLLSRVT